MNNWQCLPEKDFSIAYKNMWRKLQPDIKASMLAEISTCTAFYYIKIGKGGGNSYQKYEEISRQKAHTEA